MIKTILEEHEEMNSIRLESLENPYHIEFIKDTKINAQACEAVVQNLPTQLAGLQAAYTDELDATSILDTIQKLTAQVEELSAERAKMQTALKSGFRAMMAVADQQKAEAATTMFNLMHKYDLHAGMNFDKQTSVIDSFINDVEKNFLSLVQTAGMTELYNTLKTMNDAVCDKVIERDRAISNFGTGRMQNAREASDRAFRELRRGVNAYAYVQGYAAYAEYIGYMNALIMRYKRNYLHQSASAPEAAPGETLPPSGGEQQPDTNPDDTNQGDNNQGTGGLTPDPDAPTGGGNTNPGGGYVPPSNGGGFD